MNLSSSAQSPTGMLPEASFPLRLNDIVSNMRVSDFYLLELSADRLHSNNNTTTAATATGGDGNGTRKPFPTASSTFWLDEHHMVSSSELAETAATTTALPGNRNHGGGGIGRAMMDWTTLDDSMRSSSSPVSTTSSTTTTTTTAAAAAVGIPTAATDDIEVLSSTRQWGASPPPPQSLHNSDGTLTTTLTTVGMGHGHALQPVHTTATSPTSTAARSWQKSSGTSVVVARTSLLSEQRAVGGQPVVLPDLRQLYGTDLNIPPPNLYTEDPDHCLHMSLPWHPVTSAFSMVDLIASRTEEEAHEQQHDQRDLLDHGPVEGDTLLDPHAQATPSSRAASQGTTANEPVALSSVLPPLPRPRSHATAAGDEQQAPNPSSPPPDVVCNVSQLKQLIVAQQLGKPLAFMAHRVGPSLVLEGCASGRPMYDNPREARNKELATKLLYYSVLAKSRLDGTPQTSDAETPTAVPVAIGSNAPATHKTQQQLHHPNFTPASVMTDDDDDVLRKVDPMFRKTAQWRFNDLEILLGINTATVLEERSGKELSLCVRDAPPQPFPRAEALECWLDCVMANIDGVAICYHTDGIVQGYQVVPTAKIPQLSEGAPFEPVAVQREAGNILKWLTSACHKNGGSYVVLKDPQSPLLRLYDLSEFMAPTTNTATSNSTAHGGGGGVPSASSASSSLSPLLTSGGDAATSNTTTTYAVASTSPSSAYHHHHHHHSTHLHHSTSSATATTTLLMLEDIPQPLSHSSPKKHPTQRGQEGNERDAQTQHLLAIEEDEEEEERKLPRPSAQPLVDAVLTNELGVALTTTTTTTTTTAPSSYRGDNAEQELQRSAYRAFFHQFTYPMAMMCLRMAVSLPNSDAETLRLYQRSIQLLDQSALHHCADEEDGSSDDDDDHDDDGEDEEGGAANHRDKTNNSTGDTGTTTNRTRSNTASSPSSSKRTVEAGGVAFALAKCHEQCMLHFHSSSPLLDAEAQCVAHAEGALSAVFRALGQLKRDRALLLRNRTANETAGDDKATATAAAQAEWTLWKAKEREMEVIASEVLRCVAALANQRVRSKLFAEAMEAIAVAKSGVHLYRQFVDAESLGDEKHATEREEDEEEKGQEQERRARETKLQSVLLQLSTIFGELLVMLARELPSSLSSTLGTSSQASQTPPPRHQESTALVVSSAASKTPQQLLLSSFQQRVELAVRSVNSHVPLRLRVRLVDVATSETTLTSQQSSPSLRRSATSPSPHELEKKEEGDAAAASVATDLTALVHDFNHLLRLSLTASKTKEAAAAVKEEEKTATAMLRAGMDDMTTFSDPLLDRAVDVFSFAVRVAKRMDVAEAELQRKLASILADRGNQFVAQANAVPPQPENPSDPATTAASSSNTVSARQTVACLTRAALYFQQSSHAFQEMSDVPNTLMTALNASKMQVRLAQLQSQLLPVTPARQPQATEEKDKETADDDDAANGNSPAAIRPTAATLEITRRETALLHEAIHVLKQALMWAVDTTSMTTPATTTSASSSSSSSSSVPQVVATAATLEAILLAKAQLVNLYIVGFQRWFPSELPSKRRLCVQNLWNLWHATFPTSSHSSSPWKRIEELVYATYLLPALRAVRLGEQHPSGNSGGSSGGGSQALFDAAKADAAVLRCMVSLHGRVVGLVPCIPPPTTANEEKEDSSNSNSINHNNFLIIARTIETLWTAKTSLAEQVQSARYLTDRSRQLLQLTEHSCVSHLQTLLSSLPLLLHEERGGERGGSSSGGGSSAVAASSEQASSLSAPQMQYQQKWTVVLQNSAREWEAYFVGLQQLLAGYVFLMQHAAVVVATAGSTAVTSSSPSSVSGQTTSSASQDEDSEQVALDLISRALTSYCSVEPVLRRAVAVQERVRDCLQELEDYRRGLNNSGSSSGASKVTTKASKNGGGAAAAAAPLRNNKNLPNNRKEPFDAAVTALLDAFRGSQSSSSSSASSSTTTATTRMAVPTFEESVLRHPKALTAFQQCHSSVSAIVLRLLKTMGSSTASSSSAVEKKKKEQDLRAAARQALTLASSSTLQQKEERQGGVSSSSSSSNVPSLWEDAALLIRSLSLLFDGKKTKQSSKYL